MFLTTVNKDFPLIIFVILTGVPLGKLGLNILIDASSNLYSNEIFEFLPYIKAKPLLE